MAAPVGARNDPAVSSNCFGCAELNPVGLRMTFEPRNAGITSTVRLRGDYESFPGVVHGGIVATILDEMLAQSVYRLGQVSAFTTGLRIRYAQPMATGVDHVAYAEVLSRDADLARATARLEVADGGGLVAAADGTFRLITNDVLGLPDGRLPARFVYALRSANQIQDMSASAREQAGGRS